MHSPAIIRNVVADVLLDERRRQVWVLCPSLPAPKLKVYHGTTGELMKCTYVSSKTGECPSALLAYAYQNEEAPAYVQIDGTDICLKERLDGLRHFFSTPRSSVVTTLFKDDAHNMDPFVKYYNGKKIGGFLLYDNNPTTTATFENTIHWPLPYWSADGEGKIHLAQSTHLTHAALVCHIYSPTTWLFNFDFDEYLVMPFTFDQLCDVAAGAGCDVTGIRSIWANAAEGVVAVAKDPTSIRKSPFYFQWPQRSKYGQRHLLEKSLHRGIHAPTWCEKQVILDPHEGHLLHFAYASGATRNTNLVFLES
jgi:hypothetical protein